jgi:peptide/nickel transport system substrate-binding protein
MAMPENLSVGNESYDPLLVRTEESLALFSLVYEPLIAINEANGLTPCLAAKWSRFAGDERSWLISLRESAVFHSGERLCADDVVHSFNSLKHHGMGSHYSRTLAQVASIVKVDEFTVRVTMHNTGIMELYALDFPIQRADGSVFNGTGPYSVSSYDDERITLRANPNWWDRTPYISQIEFLARDSNDTALASYSAGQLDFVPTAQLSAGRFGENGVTEVRDHMTQNMETLLFNHRRHPTMDADFRKALSRAINRSPIISNIYMNRARSCDVPVPPDSWLYSGGSLISHDPAAAETLFSQLGCTKNDEGILMNGDTPIELTLLTSGTTDNTTRSDAAGMIASQLWEFGITVKVVTAPHSYGEAESEFMNALASMDWDIALVGFNLAASNDLRSYLTTDGSNNFGKFSGIVFTDELKAIRIADDEESLREAFRLLEVKFTEHLPFLVLYFRLNSVVFSAKLKGVAALREPYLLRGIKNWYLSDE